MDLQPPPPQLPKGAAPLSTTPTSESPTTTADSTTIITRRTKQEMHQRPRQTNRQRITMRMRLHLTRVRRPHNWPKMLRIEPLATMSLVSCTPLLTLKQTNWTIALTESLLYDLFVIINHFFWLVLSWCVLCVK